MKIIIAIEMTTRQTWVLAHGKQRGSRLLDGEFETREKALLEAETLIASFPNARIENTWIGENYEYIELWSQ